MTCNFLLCLTTIATEAAEPEPPQVRLPRIRPVVGHFLQPESCYLNHSGNNKNIIDHVERHCNYAVVVEDGADQDHLNNSRDRTASRTPIKGRLWANVFFFSLA